MCVIIYVPKESSISENEICNAWQTNPDGAGYSIQKDGRVYFKRGFMTLDSYLKEVLPLIGNYNIMLHFRISTSKQVNRVQTHPYKKGNVTITEGTTTRPVICMNGIISGQREYKGCNDTMSYIADHKDAFAVINQDILNIIEESTGAKWAVMKPDEVLLSSKFKEENGRFYSNKNHLWRTYYYTGKKSKTLNDMIKDENLKKAIRKDMELHEDLLEFIDVWCSNDNYHMCDLCTKCIKNAKTLRDIKITLNENYYYIPYYEENDNDDIIIFDDEHSEYKYEYGDCYDYCNIFDE